jgi:hypothetical protein
MSGRVLSMSACDTPMNWCSGWAGWKIGFPESNAGTRLRPIDEKATLIGKQDWIVRVVPEERRFSSDHQPNKLLAKRAVCTNARGIYCDIGTRRRRLITAETRRSLAALPHLPINSLEKTNRLVTGCLDLKTFGRIVINRSVFAPIH